MASLERRIEHLIPGKGRYLIETALVFAARRDEWLTHKDVVNFIGKNYAESTIRKAIRELSFPVESLNGLSYLDIETIGSQGKGRPRIRGKLSEAAQKRIFELVSSFKQPPRPYFIGLNKLGRAELLPADYQKKIDKWNKRKMWLSPEDILKQVENKIGGREADRLLKKFVNDGRADDAKVSRTHRWGRPPLNQFRIPGTCLMEIVTDINLKLYSLDVIIHRATDKDRKNLEDAEMVPCPSCHNLTHKSDLIRLEGAETDICITEYMHAALNATILELQADGSWRETIEGIMELTAAGPNRDLCVDDQDRRDLCRTNLFNVIMDWIRKRRKEGLDLPLPGRVQ